MITGEFKSINDITYKVEILCNHNYVIGSSDAIQFASDPITITQDVEGTIVPIIKTQAEITLLVKDYIGDYIFTANDRGIRVKIYKSNNCIFDGYIQPQTYNQDFADEYTQITLNCQDYLCTLENHKYKENTSYSNIKINATDVSFIELIRDCLGTTRTVYYDNSVKRTDNKSIFEYNGISELLIIGDEEDDLWSSEDLLNEILQYYNLHIVQIGTAFYIFSWETIKKTNSNTITWTALIGTGSKTTSKTLITVNKDLYKGNDTQLSISDVFNKIQVNCELIEKDEIFQSPLDEDSLVTPYTNKNLYLREHKDESNAKDHSWFFQYKSNKNWNLRFYDGTTVRNVNELIEYDNKGVAIKQYKIPYTLHQYKLAPMIGMFGKVETGTEGSWGQDTNVKNNLEMKPYLVITINGSEDPNVDNTTQWNTISQALQNAGGMVEYKSSTTAGVLSPTDSSVTNYIVFSGNISLQPKMMRNSGKKVIADGYFTRLYPNSNTNYETINNTLIPYLGYEDFKNLFGEYYGDWLYYRDSTDQDNINKVPILICELKIGDKYCVEVSENEFVWMTAAEAANYTFIDNDGQQVTGIETVFTLGVDPTLGDYFLCKDWEISNTLDVYSNIDTQGTAIPIKESDNLSGQVEFRIISPYYYNYDQRIRKHPTWFRSETWWTTQLKIMEFVENIYIKDFKCKLYSDNALANNTEENDLVYMSNANIQATREADEFDFKFNTALTSNEALSKGISTTSKLSNVIDLYNNTVITSLQNVVTNETGKAEELFINDLYNEYSTPKLIVITSLDYNNTDFWKHYQFSYLSGKRFYPISQIINCKHDSVQYNLKQI